MPMHVCVFDYDTCVMIIHIQEYTGVCTISKSQKLSGAMLKASLDKMLNQAYATGTFHPLLFTKCT